MNIPDNLKFTENHEWVRVDGETAFIGITDFAQSELGDIVFLEIETVGETLDAGEPFGTIEAVKTVSDVFMPVSGEILEKNEILDDKPETINTDPYGEGWMIKIKVENPEDLENLLDAKQYKDFIS